MKRKLFILSFGVVLVLNLRSQTITTFAGTGTTSCTGNGNPATSATFFDPFGLTTEASGNIYVSDISCNTVRVINPAGVINAFAGNGTAGYTGDGGFATSAQLWQPRGVVVDQLGNVYISDSYNNCIRKVDTSGFITTIGGNGVQGFSGDGGPATSASLDGPSGITIDHSGNIYVADGGNLRIRKINVSGIITTVAGNGTQGYTGDGGPALNATLYAPHGVALDASGNLYIADYGNSVIRKVNTSGVISTFAGGTQFGFGGDGGPATSAKLYLPYQIAFDGSGNLYIADSGNHRIRKVNTSGIITTIAGNGTGGYGGDGGPAINAKLDYPFGVALDASGNVYIGDSYNARVRRVNVAIGIEQYEYNDKTIQIYPNPVNGIMYIESQQNIEIQKVLINDLLGNLILETPKTSIDVGNFSNGVYFITIISGKETTTKKFVVDKS